MTSPAEMMAHDPNRKPVAGAYQVPKMEEAVPIEALLETSKHGPWYDRRWYEGVARYLASKRKC